MHTYLRAIGFSTIKDREQLDQLLGEVMTNPTSKDSFTVSETEEFIEINRDFSENVGVTVRGNYDEKGFFHLDHYFPYVKSDYSLIRDEEVLINKKVANTAYSGMCDDLRLGVSLIFYLQNAIDYIKCFDFIKAGNNIFDIHLVGLSIEGKIILPVWVNDKENEKQERERNKRNNLIAEAKMGNQEAIDSLTIEDIDTFAMITRRAKYEDIYSIVDTSFFPYGSESDNYSIIGNIIEVVSDINRYTGEEIYVLFIDCNGLPISVCINKIDLIGEPSPGMRFKGVIWMQGKVDFKKKDIVRG